MSEVRSCIIALIFWRLPFFSFTALMFVNLESQQCASLSYPQRSVYCVPNEQNKREEYWPSPTEKKNGKKEIPQEKPGTFWDLSIFFSFGISLSSCTFSSFSYSIGLFVLSCPVPSPNRLSCYWAKAAAASSSDGSSSQQAAAKVIEKTINLVVSCFR